MKNSMKIGTSLVGLSLLVLAILWWNSSKKSATDVSSTTAENTTIVETEVPVKLASENRRLPLDQICMVNNAFMGIKQIEVPFDGKMYYGCCEMCVEKIQTQKAARYATDPQTGNEVDKAVAYITLDPTGSNNAVLYFESEQTSNQYFSK